MKPRLVLAVAIDGAAASLAAARHALRLDREAGGGTELHFLNVQPTMTLAETLVAPRDIIATHWSGSLGHRALREALEAAAAAGVQVQARILNGDPAEAILRAAAEVGADMILAGARNLGGARELLIGSVARGILEGASVPVVLAG